MKNRLIVWTPLIVLLAAALAGCSKGPEAAALVLRPGIYQTNDVVRSFQEFNPDGVLVQVGGRRLTREQFEQGVRETLAQREKNGPRLQKQDDRRLKRQAYNIVFENFMARAAMLEEAESRKIVPTEEDLKAAQKYIGQICRFMRIKRADFAAQYAGGEEGLARRVTEEATLKALLREQFGALFETKDAEAEALKLKLESLKEAAVKTNEVARAQLDAVRQRLISGSLAVAATTDVQTVQSDLPHPVTFDGPITSSAFYLDDPKTAETLLSLKPGEWSEILELQDTFEFYQTLSVVPNQEEPDMTSFSFLKFSAPRDRGWIVPEIAQLKQDISKKRRKEKQGPWVAGLIRKAGVLYPNGIHLFGDLQEADTTDKSGEKTKGTAR